MYTLRKARTSATDFVTCPEFCHVSWLQQEQLPSSRSIFFHQNQKLSPDASYPPCATAVFSHCFALSFRGFRKAYFLCRLRRSSTAFWCRSLLCGRFGHRSLCFFSLSFLPLQLGLCQGFLKLGLSLNLFGRFSCFLLLGLQRLFQNVLLLPGPLRRRLRRLRGRTGLVGCCGGPIEATLKLHNLLLQGWQPLLGRFRLLQRHRGTLLALQAGTQRVLFFGRALRLLCWLSLWLRLLCTCSLGSWLPGW